MPAITRDITEDRRELDEVINSRRGGSGTVTVSMHLEDPSGIDWLESVGLQLYGELVCEVRVSRYPGDEPEVVIEDAWLEDVSLHFGDSELPPLLVDHMFDRHFVALIDALCGRPDLKRSEPTELRRRLTNQVVAKFEEEILEQASEEAGV